MSTATAVAADDGDDEKFIPSMQTPLPAFQCVGIRADGSRCPENGVVGLNPQQAVCRTHIRTLDKHKAADLKAVARAQVEAARLRLTQDTTLAIETIESLLQPGTPDAIRLKAATEILDRAGVRGGIEIDLGVEVKEDPMDEVKARLAKLIENDVTRFVEELELEAGPDGEESGGTDSFIEGSVVEDESD
jgi:hypothetical protein